MNMGFSNLFRRVRKASGDSGGEPLAEIELSIPNMVCEGCTETLEAAFHTLPGIREFQADLRYKRVYVRYESTKVDVQHLTDAAASAGFRAVDADPR